MSNPKINIEDLFNLPGAVIYNPDSFKPTSSVSTDTRNITEGSIFIALKGKKFDAHNFIRTAVDKGAVAVLINKNKLKDFDDIDCTIVTVDDTTLAYGQLAAEWRKKLKAKVIAITGSNGKTTTKEILAQILSNKNSVQKTLANNNNHIGVPLTLFSCNNSHKYLILELGTNHFGEIACTAKIAKPDYSLITNIGEGHLEFFKNKNGVAKEKAALFTETIKYGGKVFVNMDDTLLKAKAKKLKNKITFGFEAKTIVKGKLLSISDEGLPLVQVKKGKIEFKAEINLPGTSNAKNFLAAAAILLELGIAPAEIKKCAAKLTPVDKRMNIIKYPSFTLINDTYNANPVSMKSAIEFLNTFDKKLKRIAILGDMFELGDKAVQAHQQLASEIKRNRIDEVYTIGKLMKNLSESIKDKKVVNKYFTGKEKLTGFIAEKDFSNSVVLIKGSRGMKMEELIKAFEGKI
ncbi:MAG: UDP-N-acetylmuramoyl-tripeptide--D-alanyl-D-alanine ligase [Ignavibacteriales bacterium]|nr:MAG: UDP-N-acetylmuramoyl-tripeptide--D-alanyl-D-alanine ligase [Ignavibacteriales bacterium]